MTLLSEAGDPSGATGKRPFVIGLTGPIASGKSTVAAMLRDRGAIVIDADEVYRSLLAPGTELSGAIASRFGPAVLTADGQLNRAVLGEVVFEDPVALADLEQIAHPPVIAEIRRRIANTDAAVVVIEAVKLVESGLDAAVDSVWLITASPDERLRRLVANRGLSNSEARARLGASQHVAESAEAIDVRILNSGDMSRLANAVDQAWQSVVENCQKPAQIFESTKTALEVS